MKDPMNDSRASAAGIQLESDAGRIERCGERSFAVIGFVHSPDEFLLGEDVTDASIWVLSADGLSTWPLNTDRQALESCLAAFEHYLETGPVDTGPKVYTGDEMRELRERFARGEITAAKTPQPRAPHRTRVKRLMSDFRASAPSTLTPSSWWSSVLDEARDDLI